MLFSAKIAVKTLVLTISFHTTLSILKISFQNYKKQCRKQLSGKIYLTDSGKQKPEQSHNK